MIDFSVQSKKSLNLLSKELMFIDKSLPGKAMEVAQRIHERAMENLENSLGQGYTGIEYGHSQNPTEQIRNTVKFERDGLGKVIVTYESPHAEVVEFGHTQTGKIEVTRERPFPIGEQQGWTPPIFRDHFRVQPGYFYLTKAKLEIEQELNTTLHGIFRDLLR